MENPGARSPLPNYNRSPSVGNGHGEDDADRSVDNETDMTELPGFAGHPADMLRENGLDASLAPMSSIFSIFNDLTQRAFELGFLDYLRAMKGRPVKIATMCSGTESPIFASRLIAEASDRLLQNGRRGSKSSQEREVYPFAFEHKFSAEIVPFKQSFIERNFAPPILFRNIQDFGMGLEIETAYGAPAQIPPRGEVDVLIAGFACVDFSRLNTRPKALNIEAALGPEERGRSDYPESTQNEESPCPHREAMLEMSSRKKELSESFDKIRQDDGESSATFLAIVKYAKEFRPALIILENIRNAPWAAIECVFRCINYSAGQVFVDTKRYYIPHTRQRGYMLCVDNDRQGPGGPDRIVEAWKHRMCDFERVASSPVEAFLLPEENPVLKAALSEMVQKAECGEGIRSDIDWSLSQNRHLGVRVREGLGDGNPYTNWSSGRATMPTYANIAWGRSQPDRVKEMLDMLKLSDAQRDEDFEFKARYPDVSQNVDRMMGRGNAGVTGCMTPAGQGFSSLRGRPIVGLEALSLQGLSPDHLHLTRESQRELQDLAGNAMSSTVVGAAILSALIVSAGRLVPETVESSLCVRPPRSAQEERVIQESCRLEVAQMCYEEATVESDAHLCQLASATRQLCHCEGQDQIVKVPIFVCIDCGATACRTCKDIPQHNYTERRPRIERSNPRHFVQALQEVLPATLEMTSRSPSFQEEIRAYLDTAKADTQSPLLQPAGRRARVIARYLSGLQAAFGHEMRIRHIHRSNCWKVQYESSRSRLQLIIDESRLFWELFVKPDPSLPSNSLERSLFRRPVARTTTTAGFSNLLAGRWQLLIPLHQKKEVTLSGEGTLVSSWKTELGLEGVASSESKVYHRIEVRPYPGDLPRAFKALTGSYELLPACGTANRSLHVKRAKSGQRDVFLLFEPDPYGPAEDDEFIFTTDPSRLGRGEARAMLARVGKLTSTLRSARGDPAKWKPCHLLDGPTGAYCSVDTFQRKVELRLFPGCKTKCILRSPCGDSRDVNWTVPSPSSCKTATIPLITCQLPRLDTEMTEWHCPSSFSITERNERTVRVDLAWLAIGLKELCDAPEAWARMHVGGASYDCASCAPPRPRIKWVEIPTQTSRSRSAQVGRQNRVSPLEDPADTGPYELALKSRPSPFLIEIKKNCPNEGEAARISIALNLQTLAHRAIGNLTLHSKGSRIWPVETSWRISTGLGESLHGRLQAFTLQSNKETRPRRFKFSARNCETGSILKLREDQARALNWMTTRDIDLCEPFSEEIVEESTCTKLGWRLEARATRPVRARGGIVADDVGFGKTITTLALIKDRLADATEESRQSTSRLIPIRATLIVAPPTLVPQWKDEISKFWPSCKLLHVHDASNLRKRSIGDFEDADIVLLSLSLLTHEQYHKRLADFAALPSVPVLNGPREHAAWLSLVTGRIEDLSAQLHEQTPSEFASSLEQRVRDYKGDGTVQNAVPSRRLKGKDFEEHQRARAAPIAAQSHQSESHLDTPKRPILGFESAKAYSDALFPVLSLFEFHRKIVDEQTYVDDNQLQAVTSVRSRATWILSGTPYIRDFADVKRMAVFLGVFLGIDDDTAGYSREDNARAIRSSRTDFEKFQALQVNYSHEWHLHRHRIAQRFLDTFARKNRPEIPAILQTTFRDPVLLSQAHRILALEVESRLASGETKLSKNRQLDIETLDSDQRLMNLLGSSRSIPEAMAKSAIVLPPGSSLASGAGSAGSLMQTRQENSGSGEKHAPRIKARLNTALSASSALDEITLGSVTETRHRQHLAVKERLKLAIDIVRQGGDALACVLKVKFYDWTKFVRDGRYGDRHASALIKDLIEDFKEPRADEVAPHSGHQQRKPSKTPSKKTSSKGTDHHNAKKRPRAKSDIDGDQAPTPKRLKPGPVTDRKIVRQEIDKLNHLSIALVKSLRGLRFFCNAQRWLQSLASNHPSVQKVSLVETDCPCERKDPTRVQICCECGHLVCEDCLSARRLGATCTVEQCKGRALRTNMIQSADLQLSQMVNGKQANNKIHDILSLVRRWSEAEQILLFVQYQELAEALCTAFRGAGIRFQYVRSDIQAAATLKEFKNVGKGDRRWFQVLIMDPFQSSAAGHNLTNVNLVIFASPLLTSGREEYEALYTQAIGRACRFGQQKPVEIHHFLNVGTVDVNIVEGRQTKKLMLHEGQLQLTELGETGQRPLGSPVCHDMFQQSI